MDERFTPGAIVSARGRDWVVLPAGDKDVLRLRPLTASQADEVGIYLPLERAGVRPSEFTPPDPQEAGDATGVLSLFDAARLSLRSSAAPFRSLARISVTPRPYQFVPLIMALRLDPVRLLIADDVGVGKTIEAGLVARELLDRGLAKRLGVLCPAHLSDQWARELNEKFALEPALIQPSEIGRLERRLPRQDISIYQHYPHMVASVDFVKAGRHHEPFLRDAPDLVIVDEAHMCARPPGGARAAEHQRYELVRALADDPNRHLLLVTATPHSGIEASFQSLLGLLNRDFDRQAERSPERKHLVPHVVQRRRRDVETWLGADTPFPERESEEVRYELGGDYRALFHAVLDYCRETIEAASELRAAQQRVRHWAAIAILRCLLSSPDAAVAVLGGRAQRLLAEADEEATPEEIDQSYEPQVLDALGDEVSGDYAPSAPVRDVHAAWTDAELKRLAGFLKRARALRGPKSDRKLQSLADVLRRHLADGFRPIVFCRFIQTANYLGEWLPKLLRDDVADLDLRVVTGEIGEEERREKVEELARSERRLLVATDCLSEGINLQEAFDAVVHYDLPWNPNRLEQREGRVDRFNQREDVVRATLLYGTNNPVDQVVLDVLLRKARRIRRSLGIAVPVPVEAEKVIQTVVDNVLLNRPLGGETPQLELAFDTPDVSRLHNAWDQAAEREGKERAYFAQHGIQPDEVDREIKATDRVLGDSDAVRRFLADAVQRFGGKLEPTRHQAVFKLVPGNLRPKLKSVVSDEWPLPVTFDRQKDESAEYLGRTHPLTSLVCDSVLGEAFTAREQPHFARAGAVRTDAVDLRTALLLLRFRYRMREERTEEFAEEVLLAAFRRAGDGLEWIEPYETAGRELAERARPVANITQGEREEQVNWALGHLEADPEWYRPLVDWRLEELTQAHDRLRKLVKAPALRIEPHLPPDTLGCFVLLPAGGRA